MALAAFVVSVGGFRCDFYVVIVCVILGGIVGVVPGCCCIYVCVCRGYVV